jgi:hypothetical protein
VNVALIGATIREAHPTARELLIEKPTRVVFCIPRRWAMRPDVCRRSKTENEPMLNLLWGLAVLFFVMWLFGFAAFHVAGGLIHMLLVLAVIVVVVRLVMGRGIA